MRQLFCSIYIYQLVWRPTCLPCNHDEFLTTNNVRAICAPVHLRS